MKKTRLQVTAVLTAALVILVTILAVSPHTTIIANEVSGEVYGIDVVGITAARIVPADVVEGSPQWAPLIGDGSN